MDDDRQGRNPGGPDDPEPWVEAEREQARRRRFDLAETVGRAAAGQLGGASPVPASRQLLLEAGELLATRLADPDGALGRALLARLADDPALLDRCGGDAPAALAALVDRALGSPTDLQALVREADVRWGREMDERPRFESPGRPAAADDPYTLAGVAAALAAFRKDLP